MANPDITSRSPFAQIFFHLFGKKSYHSPLSVRFCAFRQTLPLTKPVNAISLMETLCVPMINRPTQYITDSGITALLIEYQLSLALLGASTKDADRRVLFRRFSP